MIAVFARQITDDLASLVKQIDATVAKHRDQQLAAFVVYLADDPSAGVNELKQLAEKHQIAHTPLTLFNDRRERVEQSYNLSTKRGVTVIMWSDLQVRACHWWAGEQIPASAVRDIVRDATKLFD